MQTLLIYNPKAGNGQFVNHLDRIIDQFQEHGQPIVPYRLNHLEQLGEMLKAVSPARFGKILVAGGDGTVHQVINGVLKAGLDIPVGIYPTGTANDFAQNFYLPKSIDEATKIFINGNLTYCDVGVVNGQYFINVASVGFLIDISQRTDPAFKNNLGVLAYYLKGLEELPNMRPVKVKFTSKQYSMEEEIYFMLAMNGRSAGGFKKIAPLATVTDGAMDVFIFKKCPFLELMPLIFQIVNGEHISSPYVTYFKTDYIKVESDVDLGTDLDGEKGVGLPMELSIQPRCLRILTRNNQEEPYEEGGFLKFSDVKRTFEEISKNMIKDIQNAIPSQIESHRSIQSVAELIRDIPRHNAFSYVNRQSLGPSYFEKAQKNLENGYLYLVLSSTGSAAGEMIQKVTKKEYSHVSLAFDEDLETIVSFNGGERVYAPGMNREMVEFFYKKPDANIVIYKLKATKDQKQVILEAIRQIDEEGSSYNVLGLVVKYSHQENIMFCSQFVYAMLKRGGLEYFQKRPEEVRPTDFVELDYERRLEYHGRIFLKDIFIAKK